MVPEKSRSRHQTSESGTVMFGMGRLGYLNPWRTLFLSPRFPPFPPQFVSSKAACGTRSHPGGPVWYERFLTHPRAPLPGPAFEPCQRSRMLPETEGRLVHLVQAGCWKRLQSRWRMRAQHFFCASVSEFMPSLHSLLKGSNREAARLLVSAEHSGARNQHFPWTRFTENRSDSLPLRGQLLPLVIWPLWLLSWSEQRVWSWQRAVDNPHNNVIGTTVFTSGSFRRGGCDFEMLIFEERQCWFVHG